jgi:hypothetical protein
MPEQNEPARTGAEQALKLDASSAAATYSNLCRVSGTPEEVIMEFALNPNPYGQSESEAIKVDHRIVMGYHAAKRTAMILAETLRRYEERFGVIELDVRKRMQQPPAGGQQ